MFAMSALELHMRAEGHTENHVVQLNAFGLNNFTLGTQPLTRIGPREIRIRVGAVSLSYRDLLVARAQLVPHASDITLPLIPLSDCAGEVVEVGSDATGSVDMLPILGKALRLQGIVLGSVEMFERMNGAIDSLGIKPVIDTTFRMQDIAISAALEYLESGQHVGKVVITL
jgi:NADPH:quinone reductase-like Zn-dependent oxidoreductase